MKFLSNMDLHDFLSLLTREWLQRHMLLEIKLRPHAFDGSSADLLFYDSFTKELVGLEVALYRDAEIEQVRRWVARLQRPVHVLSNALIEFAAGRANNVDLDSGYVRDHLR